MTLAAGAVTAPLALHTFAFRSPVHTMLFQDPADAAGAFAALWVTLWAVFLLLEAVFLFPLEKAGESARPVVIAVASAARIGLALWFVMDPASPYLPLLGLTLAIAAPAGLYRLFLEPAAGFGGRNPAPIALICAVAAFSIAAAYYWTVNYSSYSFEAGTSVKWIGLSALLACAVPVAVFGGRSVRTWIWTAAIALGGAFLFWRMRDSIPEPLPVGGLSNGPSVIVITIDTLRADALSCYQPGLGDTPNIDQLARDGALFRQAYSPASWTIPSMTSLFTGAAPLVHGVSQPVQDAALPTMADYFLGAGYDTVGVFGNPVLTNQRVLVRNAALRAYFDVYHGFRALRLFHSNLLGETYAAQFYGRLRGLNGERGANTAGLADLAIERIRAHGDGPLFLWTHFYDPHGPFAPVEELIPATPPQPAGIGTEVGTFNARFGTVYFKPEQRPWVRALYQAETHYVDAAVGRILDALREAGAYDDALIVLTSDHGEQFWEHGRVGHGNSLHREAVLVPLIVKAPRARPGRIVETPVENRALLPTMLDLAAIPHEEQPFWAPSLVPLLDGTGGYGDGAPIVTSGVELFEDEAAIRIGDLRYIRMLYSGHESLFDLASDPGELHSILRDRPEDAERMRRALDHHLGESQQLRESLGLTDDTTQPFDDETLRRLKSLGYL